MSVHKRLVSSVSFGETMECVSSEPDLLRDKRVLFAIRNGETAAAAHDWLSYHVTTHKADAALIFDRDPPEEAVFADKLQALQPDSPVLVVNAERPLGKNGAPDARHPAFAPSTLKRELPPVDPWHAPIAETTIFEMLRRLFLTEAMAVALLDIADMVLPRESGALFDLVAKTPGLAVRLQGIESYPWRLRQNKPAPHGDHIAQRSGERRRLVSWAASMANMPSPLRPGHPPHGMGVSSIPPLRFSRAMGIVFPAVKVNSLVRKPELVECEDLVRFASDFLGANPVRLPERRAIPPRPQSNRVTIVTAMKNEGPFILDWIAHNRSIGIDHHLVYTNDCDDGTDRLLEALQDAGVTHKINPYRNTGQVPQHAAFCAAEDEEVVKESDWLLTLDVDEYINIHAGNGHLTDLLSAAAQAHVISMPWRLFGNADINSFSDKPVTLQFQKAAPAFAPRPLQAWAFKSLFRNAGLFRRLGVHRPKGVVSDYVAQMSWVDGSGRVLPAAFWQKAWRMSKAHWGYELVSVNHYAVRSAESFLVKRDRGRVNHTTRDQNAAYWFRMNQNGDTDTSIQRHVPGAEAEKDRLLALPGVAEAHAAAVDWHRQRIKILRAQAEHAVFFEEITSERMQRLSRMATNFGMNVQMSGPHVIPDEVVARDPAIPFFFTVEMSRTD